KVEVNYEKDPESVLREVMLIAANNNYGEPLSWSGWVPAIDESGSSSVTGGIKVDYNPEEGKLGFEPNEGIKIQASEYVIGKKSSEKLTLSGTKEGIEAVSEDDAESKKEQKDNLRHRIDLVRIEEGYKKLEELKTKEKTFIIGLDNQQYQTQIEIPPKE
ncbi:11915_t:CDS:2, partial [Diversispora eburnea]